MSSVGSTGSFTIADFIHGRDVMLSVPSLQRGFVWKAKNVRELFRSIETHMSLGMDMFLGTVMIFNTGEKQDEIIDGQQRLTTIGMLARVLSDQTLTKKQRPIIESLWKNAKDEHRIEHNTTPDHQNYMYVLEEHTKWTKVVGLAYEKRRVLIDLFEEGKKRIEERNAQKKVLQSFKSGLKDLKKDLKSEKDPKQKKILEDMQTKFEGEIAATTTVLEKLNETLKADKKNFINERNIFWKWADDEVIVSDGKFRIHEDVWTDENRTNRITECYHTICDYVKNLTEQPQKFEKFVDFLIHNIEIIVIEISDKNQVHMVFKSLNSFGVMLSAGEKVKNDLFHFATQANEIRTAQRQWESIQTTLTGIQSKGKEDDVISHFLWTFCKANGHHSVPGSTTKN